MSNIWMVRAGRGGYVFDDFEKSSCVAIGWNELNNLSKVGTKDKLRKLITEAYPESKPGQISISTGMIGRFLLDMKLGDPVLSYDTDSREYIVGEITGEYKYDESIIPDHPHTRQVSWHGKVNRDDLTVASRNTLGAIQTLFTIGTDVWKEINKLQKGEHIDKATEEEKEEFEQIREDILSRSHEFIKDQVQRLDWDEMQELVAGILRAMGYKTHVSGPGPDRGKDIIASPDGLGFEHPRIRVEVKHRPKESMGSSQIRSFIGALRQNDRGLYVSTGGFSKEAHYEAERATVPVTLLDLDGLVSLLTSQYENLDTTTRALVPLTRVYWPA